MPEQPIAVQPVAPDLRGFAVSTAIGLSGERARSNTLEQVDALIEAIESSVTHLRRISVHA